MTDTVADLNQVKIAMLRRPAAVHWDTGDDRLTRHTPGTLHPEARNWIGPGEQK